LRQICDTSYFGNAAQKRHARSSESIRINWKRTLELMKLFAGEYLPFSKIDKHFAEDFRATKKKKKRRGFGM
jgi:hypothetical protein